MKINAIIFILSVKKECDLYIREYKNFLTNLNWIRWNLNSIKFKQKNKINNIVTILAKNAKNEYLSTDKTFDKIEHKINNSYQNINNLNPKSIKNNNLDNLFEKINTDLYWRVIL